MYMFFVIEEEGKPSSNLKRSPRSHNSREIR